MVESAKIMDIDIKRVFVWLRWLSNWMICYNIDLFLSETFKEVWQSLVSPYRNFGHKRAYSSRLRTAYSRTSSANFCRWKLCKMKLLNQLEKIRLNYEETPKSYTYTFKTWLRPWRPFQVAPEYYILVMHCRDGKCLSHPCLEQPTHTRKSSQNISMQVLQFQRRVLATPVTRRQPLYASTNTGEQPLTCTCAKCRNIGCYFAIFETENQPAPENGKTCRLSIQMWNRLTQMILWNRMWSSWWCNYQPLHKNIWVAA